MAEERRRAAGRLDHRLEVLDLALDRVRLGVPAVAPTPAVVAVDGEVPGEQLRELRSGPAGVPGSPDDDQGRTFSDALVGDRRSIG